MFKINSYYNPDEQQSLEYHRVLLKKAEQAGSVRQAKQAHESKPASPHAKATLKEFLLRLNGLKFSHIVSSMRSG